MDLFAHVHGEDEREPAGAEVGARLDPAKTQIQLPSLFYSFARNTFIKNKSTH